MRKIEKKKSWLVLEDDTQSGHNMDLEYAHVYNELFSDTKTALAAIRSQGTKKRPLNIDVNRTIAILEVEGMDLKCKVGIIKLQQLHNPNIRPGSYKKSQNLTLHILKSNHRESLVSHFCQDRRA